MDTVTIPRQELEDMKAKLESLLATTPTPDHVVVIGNPPYAKSPDHRLLAWRTSHERFILPNETRELRFRFSVRRPVEATLTVAEVGLTPGLSLGQLKTTRSDRGMVPISYNGPQVPDGTLLGTVFLSTLDKKLVTNGIRVLYGASRKPPMSPEEARKLRS